MLEMRRNALRTAAVPCGQCSKAAMPAVGAKFGCLTIRQSCQRRLQNPFRRSGPGTGDLSFAAPQVPRGSAGSARVPSPVAGRILSRVNHLRDGAVGYDDPLLLVRHFFLRYNLPDRGARHEKKRTNSKLHRKVNKRWVSRLLAGIVADATDSP